MTAVAHAMKALDWWMAVAVQISHQETCIKAFNWWVVPHMANPEQMWWGELVECSPTPIIPAELVHETNCSELTKYNDALLEWGRSLKAGPPQGRRSKAA
jgi:hypothetical protein